jgi:serine/threonine protein kinase
LPAAERPPPAVLDRLAHEYGLKDALDGSSAVRPLQLVRDAGRAVLALEDSGGEPLERLLGSPIELGIYLRLAIGIAVALGNVHRRGLVHKDLKPAHILVNCIDGGVRLTGFGIASRLPRERQTPGLPELIAGTLAYMAPEQTGRINRSVDSRSDLYALGVIFYQMLTGRLPFVASNPGEWVHCHIARRPLPPNERLHQLPPQVSAIVMKLLAKSPEERYQTAAGAERDLRRCHADWEARQLIDDFPLAQCDTPDRLVIPEKLYGRSREVESLLGAFDRVASSGEREFLLVSGYPGIGKSAVVDELQKVLAGRTFTFPVRKVRSIQARRSLFDARSSVSESGANVVEHERGRAGRLARRARRCASLGGAAYDGSNTRIEARHRRIAAASRASVTAGTTPLPACRPALHRRICHEGAPAGVVPRRSAMGRYGHARPLG